MYQPMMLPNSLTYLKAKRARNRVFGVLSIVSRYQKIAATSAPITAKPAGFWKNGIVWCMIRLWIVVEKAERCHGLRFEDHEVHLFARDKEPGFSHHGFVLSEWQVH